MATLWNPAHKSSTLTLNGDGTTATATVQASSNVLAGPALVGKVYFELDTTLTDGYTGIGVGDVSITLDASFPGYSDAHGCLAQPKGNYAYAEGNHNNLPCALVLGGLYRIAVDVPNRLIWFASWNKAGGSDPNNFNSNAGAQGTNPSTGLNGFAFPSAGPDIFPCVSLYNVGDAAHLLTHAANFYGPIPTGFSAPDAAPAPPASSAAYAFIMA